MNSRTTPVVRWLLVSMMATSPMASADDVTAREDSEAEAARVAVDGTTTAFEPSIGFTSSFSSRYVFRGQAYSSGPVSQSMAWVELGSVSVYAWNNVLLTREPLQRRLNEVDVGVAYSREIGALTLTPALDHYTYRTIRPLEDPPTLEASVKASLDLGSVRVFSQPIVDLASARGAVFLRNGMAHELPLGERATLTTDVSVGWASSGYNEYYVGLARAALHHAGVDLALEHRITSSLYLTYQLGLTRVLDGPLRRSVDAPDVLRLGVTLGVDVN